MMKNISLLIGCLFIAGGMAAQCSDLFISEYVEGTFNNKAIEIYNPTATAINLSGYAIGRFSNGATSTASTNGDPVVLPNVMLAPYDAYVVVLDKRIDNAAGLELPVWNGYNAFEVVYDSYTGLPLDDFCRCGDLLAVQYIGNSTSNPYEYSTFYSSSFDLESKADTFACPNYNANGHMYYNGNDAVFLISGATVLADGSNIIDVIGVIGEDPQTTIGQPAWVDNNNKWVTRDITITRQASIGGGTGLVIDVLGYPNTFAYYDWDYHCNNDFTNLGFHDCECDPDFVTVTDPPLVEIVLENLTNSCSNTGGAIDISISGGFPPYSYDWDNDGIGDNNDTEDLSGLSDGIYNVTVTDMSGCGVMLSATVVEDCPCQTLLAVPGIIQNNLYQAGTDVFSDGIVPSGASVQFKAGQKISLLTGFSVEQQADFSAEIDDCN